MPAKKHDFTVTEIKAGVTVLLTVMVLGLFVAVILGWRPPAAVRTFHTDFTDTAGLNEGGDVRFGGVKAGTVQSIRPSPEDQSKLRVVWTIREEFPVNRASEAYVSNVSIASDMHLQVTTGTADAPRLEDGAAVRGRKSGGGLMELAATVQETLEDLRTLLGVRGTGEDAEKKLTSLADLIASTDGTVSGGSKLIRSIEETLDGTWESLESILAKLEALEDAAQKLVEQVDSVVAENRQDIRGTLSGTHQIVKKVTAVADGLQEAGDKLEALLANAESLSGNTKDFIARSRRPLEDMVADLREGVRDLKRFARILAEEPQALIRGRSPTGRR